MDPIFTLPYPEYAVAIELNKHFKKNDGYSISIPLSRQEKGFDLILYNNKSKKVITIQVKASRIYKGSIPKRKTKHQKFKYYTWFNNFIVEKGYADFYILFGVYTKQLENKKLDKSRKASKWYSHILLVFNENEMKKFLTGLVTRRGKPEDKFGFGFDDLKNVYLTRGAPKVKEISEYLFHKKVNKIKKML